MSDATIITLTNMIKADKQAATIACKMTCILFSRYLAAVLAGLLK